MFSNMIFKCNSNLNGYFHDRESKIIHRYAQLTIGYCWFEKKIVGTNLIT